MNAVYTFDQQRLQNNFKMATRQCDYTRSFLIRSAGGEGGIDTVNFAFCSTPTNSPTRTLRVQRPDNNTSHGYARGSYASTAFYSINTVRPDASSDPAHESRGMNPIVAAVKWRKGDNACAWRR